MGDNILEVIKEERVVVGPELLCEFDCGIGRYGYDRSFRSMCFGDCFVCLTFLLAVQDCLKSVDFFLVSLEMLDLLLKK